MSFGDVLNDTKKVKVDSFVCLISEKHFNIIFKVLGEKYPYIAEFLIIVENEGLSKLEKSKISEFMMSLFSMEHIKSIMPNKIWNFLQDLENIENEEIELICSTSPMVGFTIQICKHDPLLLENLQRLMIFLVDKAESVFQAATGFDDENDAEIPEPLLLDDIELVSGTYWSAPVKRGMVNFKNLYQSNCKHDNTCNKIFSHDRNWTAGIFAGWCRHGKIYLCFLFSNSIITCRLPSRILLLF